MYGVTAEVQLKLYSDDFHPRWAKWLWTFFCWTYVCDCAQQQLLHCGDISKHVDKNDFSLQSDLMRSRPIWLDEPLLFTLLAQYPWLLFFDLLPASQRADWPWTQRDILSCINHTNREQGFCQMSAYPLIDGISEGWGYSLQWLWISSTRLVGSYGYWQNTVPQPLHTKIAMCERRRFYVWLTCVTGWSFQRFRTELPPLVF